MKVLAFIIKPFLNIVAWFLKLSRHNIYYLVSGPLRNEIQEVSFYVFAYQHIDAAISIAQSLNNVKGNTILDVGGGQATTAEIFQKAYPNHKIYIFEPIQSNAQIIAKTAIQYSNWNLITKAAGSQIGTSQINIAQRVTASSLLELDTNILGEGTYKDVLAFKNTEAISLTTLDSEISSDAIIDVLKMDVQGYELEVLKGASSTIARTKVIVFEVNNHQGFKNAPTYYNIDSFLRLHNFVLYDMYPNHRENGKLMDCDSIYVNQKFLN